MLVPLTKDTKMEIKPTAAIVDNNSGHIMDYLPIGPIKRFVTYKGIESFKGATITLDQEYYLIIVNSRKNKSKNIDLPVRYGAINYKVAIWCIKKLLEEWDNGNRLYKKVLFACETKADYIRIFNRLSVEDLNIRRSLIATSPYRLEIMPKYKLFKEDKK